jgi:hypothetical protein
MPGHYGGGMKPKKKKKKAKKSKMGKRLPKGIIICPMGDS